MVNLCTNDTPAYKHDKTYRFRHCQSVVDKIAVRVDRNPPTDSVDIRRPVTVHGRGRRGRASCPWDTVPGAGVPCELAGSCSHSHPPGTSSARLLYKINNKTTIEHCWPASCLTLATTQSTIIIIISTRTDVCRIARIILWIHQVVGFSHFAECCESRPVTV